MNILVLTSSMIDTDFAIYQEKAKIKSNPSNQNFYSRLIKTLKIGNRVSVVSHRPFVKGMFRQLSLDSEQASSENIIYYYTHVESNKIYKLLREEKSIEEMAEKAIEDFHSNDFIIVTDTLRYNLVKAARKIAGKHNVKVVGMLTDNPDNISNVNKLYKRKIKGIISSLDGYLSLTNDLVNVFNREAPSYIFEGLVSEEESYKKDPITNYYFFAGSLYERYGVKTLVDAFHESNIKNKLVIAGNGPLSKYIEKLSEDDYRILYLSQISKERVISYMKNSIANINPRPIKPDLDKESVPSKLLEYLSIGNPTISTKYEKLYGPFKDDVTWINGNEKQDITNAINQFEQLSSEDAKKKAIRAKTKIFEFYGTGVQAESISHFLLMVNASVNF